MKNGSTGQPSTSQAAQTSTVRSLPQTVVRHSNPNVTPVGSKAMTGKK